MIWFKHRRKIERLYYEWAHLNGVKNTPISLIAFMQIKGWLNEGKILVDITEQNEEEK